MFRGGGRARVCPLRKINELGNKGEARWVENNAGMAHTIPEQRRNIRVAGTKANLKTEELIILKVMVV